MAEVQIKRVSIKHDAIMDYLLVNPNQKLGLVAAHFEVSQAWLSVIIHSDAFQAGLAEKNSECFGATIIPLREKLLGVAHVGVDKLGECLENASAASDKQFIADTTDSILKNLGYSPKSAAPAISPAGNTTNVFVVDKAALEAARNTMRTINPEEEIPLSIEGKLLEPEADGVTSEEV